MALQFVRAYWTFEGEMNENIKPCPFCGGNEVSISEGSTFRWVRVECRCGVIGPEVRKQTAGSGTKEEWFCDAAARAIVEWNKRV